MQKAMVASRETRDHDHKSVQILHLPGVKNAVWRLTDSAMLGFVIRFEAALVVTAIVAADAENDTSVFVSLFFVNAMWVMGLSQRYKLCVRTQV